MIKESVRSMNGERVENERGGYHLFVEFGDHDVSLGRESSDASATAPLNLKARRCARGWWVGGWVVGGRVGSLAAELPQGGVMAVHLATLARGAVGMSSHGRSHRSWPVCVDERPHFACTMGE